MSSSNDQRLSEAQECLKRADNHLKTSLIKLKLKPDFDSAAMEYERAAVCYKNANEQGLCKDTYLKAADCHASNRNMFHAAKAKENAAVVARDMGDTLSAILYYEQACDLYAESGTMDTAAMTIDKAAKWMEMADPEKSIAFYKKGLAFVQQTDRSRMAGDFLTRITKLNLKLERYTEAAASVEEEIEKYIEVKEAGRVGQLTTALCLIWLANGDPIAAKRAYGKALKLTGFEHSEDGLACASIISNFESGDDDAFQASLCRPTLRAMDNEYLRLMKKIKIEDEFSNMNISKPVQNENAKFDESQKAPPNEEAVIRCPEPVAVPVVADELVREIHAAPVPTKVESDEDEDDLK